MIPLPVAEVAAVLGAALSGPGDPQALITGVTADSRAVTPGALFVALPGTRVDGHDFVAGAYAAGAAAALTARPVAGAPCLVVPDPLAALGRLARHLVDRGKRGPGGLRVVGITGSQGKTSTKDLLGQVLQTSGPTVAPAGNLNNELGLPLTVARIDEQTRFLVAEMGARGVGHIAYLCQVAPPDVGVVLHVGHAHLSEFGSRDAIARAKGELVEALPADGVAVLNAQDPRVWGMRIRTEASVLAFSTAGPPEGPGVWAGELVVDPVGRYRFVLHTQGLEAPADPAEVRLQVAGRHQVSNALAAAAAALALGLEPAAVATGLSAATAQSRWRMELHQRSDGLTVLNDAYNANPDSMAAAVGTLAELSEQRRRRTWAVLGDMLELGDEADRAHADLGALVAGTGIDRLVAVGAYATPMATAARAAGLRDAEAVRAYGDKAAAQADLLARLAPGDVVLVKASRGLALDTVAEAILASGEEPGA